MTTVDQLPVRYVLNEREYELLRRCISRASSRQVDGSQNDSDQKNDTKPESALGHDDHKAAAFRSASRVFLLTFGSLKAAQSIMSRLAGAAESRPATRARKTLVASNAKMALSLSSLLFFHATLYRIFVRLRLQLLHEKVRSIRERHPRIYAALTARVAPAVGASLSGFALGICPADQLRVTLAIYVACRALELGYAAVEQTGLVKKHKPAWLGSWVLFAVSQGQLLHAFVFDRDCFPEAYGSFILGYTPEYIQKRPENLSPKVVWPRPDDVVDALAQMARLKWPSFVSPILHPHNAHALPPGIDPVISPVTSRAHPATRHLSCALLHPSDPSCFMAYLRHNLLAFPQLARFFAMYYGAFTILRFRKFLDSPITSLNRLSESVLRTTMAVSGAIGASWASICFFQAVLPRAFLPKSRFFLGGLLGGLFQLFDRTAAGHVNSLYAARTSVDSLWKVGVKHRWWRGIRAGDVWLFVAALALTNVVYDLGKETAAGQDQAMILIKVLRGEVELGLQKGKEKDTVTKGVKDDPKEVK